jgi:hypothetical protein
MDDTDVDAFSSFLLLHIRINSAANAVSIIITRRKYR